MNHFIFINGYVFKQTNFDYIELANKLVKSNKITYGIDSELNIYFNKTIYPHSNNFEDQMKSFENNDILMKLYKFRQHLSYFNSENYFLLNLKPIKIKYKNTNELNLDIYMVLYKDNTINIIFDLKLTNNIDYMIINDLIHSNEQFEYILLPNEYPNLNNNNFISLINSLFVLVKDYSNLFNSLNRSIIVLNNIIDKQDIYKLLYSSNMTFKDNFDLKDFRMVTDYSLYTNEMQGLAYGINIERNIYYFLILESKIVNSLLYDTRVKNNLIDNYYSLKELYKIKNDYLFETSFDIYIDYIEANNYVKYVFELMNRKKVIEAISNSIESKKIDNQNHKNILLSILTSVLSCIPLYNYIIEPIIVNEIDSLTVTINDIKSVIYPYNVLIVLILLCSLFLIFNKLFNNKI